MTRSQNRAVLALAVLLGTVGSASAITLADSNTFTVKRTWTAATLGLSTPLGGLGFSPDGSVLYVVASANENSSKMMAVSVTRDPVTHEVTALGPSNAAFNGNNPLQGEAAGLDAAAEFGPAGTFFYSYFPANFLGQRPGGVAGGESVTDITPLGIDPSIGAIAFSPFRTDPGTGFGAMQTANGQGEIFEVSLNPAGGGLFTPTLATLLVTLPQGGTAGLQYVPAGAFAGTLLYASFNFQEVHILHIDPGTGLPVGGPVMPVEELFASTFGAAPLGLEIDPITNDDLFISLYDMDTAANNTLIQIGGFAQQIATTTSTRQGGPRTTTTVTTSSTSSSSSSSSSSSLTTSSSSSTSTSTSSSTSTTTRPCMDGECNDDGTLTTADVTCVTLRLFEQLPMRNECEDCNQDGLLTTADVSCTILCLFDVCQ